MNFLSFILREVCDFFLVLKKTGKLFSLHNFTILNHEIFQSDTPILYIYQFALYKLYKS